MKKIMFSHKWGLHQAVLAGEKPTTLRLIPEKTIEACKDPDNPFDYPDRDKLLQASPVQVGDIVAVAECYKDRFGHNLAISKAFEDKPGWKNKMYVAPGLMRYYIIIEGIEVRELQTLTPDELKADGLDAFRRKLMEQPRLAKQARNGHIVAEFFYRTMRIDILKEFPLVYRYTFTLIDTYGYDNVEAYIAALTDEIPF